MKEEKFRIKKEAKEKGKKEGRQKKESEKWITIFLFPLFFFFWLCKLICDN